MSAPVTRFDKNVILAWQLPRDARVAGEWFDGSRYAVVHRLDGSYLSITTAKGAAGVLHHSTRIRKLPDGTYVALK